MNRPSRWRGNEAASTCMGTAGTCDGDWGLVRVGEEIARELVKESDGEELVRHDDGASADLSDCL
jgi:hypothetical protein